MLAPCKQSCDTPRQHIKKQRHYFTNKDPNNLTPIMAKVSTCISLASSSGHLDYNCQNPTETSSSKERSLFQGNKGTHRNQDSHSFLSTRPLNPTSEPAPETVSLPLIFGAHRTVPETTPPSSLKLLEASWHCSGRSPSPRERIR